jgi:hypothetical protein
VQAGVKTICTVRDDTSYETVPLVVTFWIVLFFEWFGALIVQRTVSIGSDRSPNHRSVRSLLSHEQRPIAKKFYHRILALRVSVAIWQGISAAVRIRSRSGAFL